MEVRTNGIMASNSETHLANGGSNKENPWDFIEKEILEFQSIVKELEDYSMKNSKYFENPDAFIDSTFKYCFQLFLTLKSV